MADNNNHMGNDPLAWLAEDTGALATEQPLPKNRTRRSAMGVMVDTKKTDTELVEESFAALASQGDQIVADFYSLLFKNHPELSPLFEGVSTAGQQKKLLAALVMLVQNLRQPEVLEEYLKGLGSRHQAYGVEAEDYDKVAQSLLSALKKRAGGLWSMDVENAWTKTLLAVKEIMLGAYEPVAKQSPELRPQDDELVRMRSALEGSQTALMMCDENRVITYCNPAVLALLRRRLADLKTLFPRISLETLVGTNMDVFHRDPSLQAAILSDPSRLPHKSQIKMLDLHFDLNATAIMDDNGNMIGNMVEWRDITEQKQGEAEIANLIEAAKRGELKQRLNANHYQGFMATIAQGINDLMDVVLAPTEDTIKVAQALANGDLTCQLEGNYQGMFAELADALNGSVDKMAQTVTDITEASISISAAATEISQGNIDLSQRTEEQASSLDETASSMEELTSTVKQNSDNARQANLLAASAREKAEKGGAVIQRAVTAMTEISTSSKKVADIIGVIDDIAFQTNLLALNAAVEAARAGDQGRGFAVVASEVRSLAQRSAAAAKEIKTLISDSEEKVKEGSLLVNESGHTLEDIVDGAKKVGDIIAEIAAASIEQASGIEQINKAVSQMDEMTQQNAALVEQAAAASESLDEQGQNLQNLMAFFNTGKPVAMPPRIDKRVAVRRAQRVARENRAEQRKPPSVAVDDDEWDEF